MMLTNAQTPIEFTVTIQDLRPGHEGIYRQKFVAQTRFDAIEGFVGTLVMPGGLEEGRDFRIVDVR
jgi:hypothetical protein